MLFIVKSMQPFTKKKNWMILFIHLSTSVLMKFDIYFRFTCSWQAITVNEISVYGMIHVCFSQVLKLFYARLQLPVELNCELLLLLLLIIHSCLHINFVLISFFCFVLNLFHSPWVCSLFKKKILLFYLRICLKCYIHRNSQKKVFATKLILQYHMI